MLSGKGSLLDESLLVMQQLAQGRAVHEVKSMVMEEDLLGKATASTRASSWDHIHIRYLSPGSPTQALARMVAHAPDRQNQRLVLFYELCRSLPIVHDSVIDCVYPRYAAGYSELDASDIQAFFDAVSQDHREISTWSPQTRSKIVSNILSILRDFGLLEGTQRKRFVRLYVPLPAFVYVLYRLAGDGLTPAAELIAADDWKLYLLEREEILALLEEASAAGHCTYKRRGDIQSLDLTYPSLEACVEALTAEV
jgi:hypothetical protein